MKMRLQGDADFNEIIVAGLERIEPSIDFQTYSDVGLMGLPDPEVLALAALENRVLVSHDNRTMPTHFGEFIISHDCSGVIIIAQSVKIHAAIDALLLQWATVDADEMRNRIIWLPY